ncbi:transcriptional regulator, CdaR family [Rathayibacter oskolensis]|uniref:Transcriptional regulator, CdaR family n=1 Tax=Rathayibacter oskolensis TaxID=1891671 RepID=A0A1X7P0W0_9MICO|nr:PucR family transcriptional regulator [Rathayibacter oskolensis]SMH43892.1 transcriptional regulator, CdaR family [Rathayibacter oskolensis]
MCAVSDPPSVARSDIDATGRSDLFDFSRAGSAILEQPTVRRTVRLASAAARTITGCAVLAVYIADRGTLSRYSGRANRRLDLLVEARAGSSGALTSDRGWRYALFLRAGGAVRGAFALEAAAEPSREALVLLCALAEPAGAALAATELLERERRRARELWRLGEAQASENRTLAATIARLDAHEHIRVAFDAAAGDGETRIIAVLSALTGRSVVLQDSFGNERAFVPVDGSAAPPNLRSCVGAPAAARGAPGWRCTTICSGEEAVGVIGVHDPDDDLSDDDLFALEHARALMAIELVHHRSIAEVEIRLGRDLADDLVAGCDGVEALARAELLHFDLSGHLRAVLVSWERPTPSRVDIATALRHELTVMHAPALVSRRTDGAVLAIVSDRHDLSGLYERLASTTDSARGTIGVGGRCVARDLPRSFAEATRTLRIRVESSQPHGFSHHDDLGLLRILDTSDGGVELAAYLETWLGALIAHDRDHHPELVRTLTVYLDSGGNYDRTAEALTIHRSTLRYRLGRIRELSGRDLADPECRFNLHIAVRARAALRDGSR